MDVEKGLHDLEETCAAQNCNAIEVTACIVYVLHNSTKEFY